MTFALASAQSEAVHIDPYALQASLALIVLAIAGLIVIVLADMENTKRRRRR